MDRRIRFFLGIAVLSPVLFLLWEVWAKDGYLPVLRRIASLVIGDEPREVAVPVSVSNVVPFVVMMLATPGMRVRRMLRGIGMGIIVLFLVHLLAVVFYTHWMTHPDPSPPRMFASFLVSAVQMALPFALWMLLARAAIRSLVSQTKEDELESA